MVEGRRSQNANLSTVTVALHERKMFGKEHAYSEGQKEMGIK